MKTILMLTIFIVFTIVSCGNSNTGDLNSDDISDISDEIISSDSDTVEVSDEATSNCPENNKFCRSHDGVNWSDVSKDLFNWNDASIYCEGLGGRLPTISELRTLIQNCPGTEMDGECNVFDECITDSCWNEACEGCDYDTSGKYNVFGDIGWFWSSKPNTERSFKAWMVDYKWGSFSAYIKDKKLMYGLCVEK